MRVLSRDEIAECEKFNYPSDLGRTFEEFLLINHLKEEDVTEEITNWFADHVCLERPWHNQYTLLSNSERDVPISTYIENLLRESTIKFLVGKLNIAFTDDQKLPIYADFKNSYPDLNIYYIKIPRKHNLTIVSKLCDSMLWTMTPLNNMYDGNYGTILVQKQPSHNITPFVKMQCNGKLYHITTKECFDKIERLGLIPPGTGDNFTFEKGKLFFVCGSNEEDLSNHVKSVAKTLKKFSDGAFNPDMKILEVDISNYNINVYEDPMYYNSHTAYACFSYIYIPPRNIKDVTNKFL